MTVLGTGRRGQFCIMDLDASSARGVQVLIPGGGDPVGSSSLVTSFGVEQRENYSVSQCLNGGVFVYTFGHDPQQSGFSLGITSFVNNGCSGGSGDLGLALRVYEAGRVSRSKALATLSIGDAAIRGYLTGQSVQVVNSEIGAFVANYVFISIDPQGVS